MIEFLPRGAYWTTIVYDRSIQERLIESFANPLRFYDENPTKIVVSRRYVYTSGMRNPRGYKDVQQPITGLTGLDPSNIFSKTNN